MISLATARLHWQARQQLGGDADPATVPGGWIRALGGIGPYLALHARCGTTKDDADALQASDAVQVVPGVRGCIWLVAAEDVGLALKVGHAVYAKRTERELAKLDVSRAELLSLAEEAAAAIGGEGLTPKALRDVLGDKVRSLGAAGKKRGHNTTLPAALRYAEAAGWIRRRHEGGVLDTERYLWERTTRPLPDAPDDPADQARELADRFLAWAGPATIAEFVDWSKLGKRASAAAFEAVGAVAVEVEGLGTAWVHPDHAETIADPPVADRVHLLPCLDNLHTLRGSAASLVADHQRGRELLATGSRPVALSKTAWFLNRPMIHRGEIVGLWEVDPDAGEVVYGGFDPLPGAIREAADRAAVITRSFVADSLGGSWKVNSIDSRRMLEERLAYLKALS